jgi:hypothetical protein
LNDWIAWHADYDSDTPLRRRLAIVQRHIRNALDEFEGSPLRVVSMCAGEARDLLGAVESSERRDIIGRLVELDPELARRAQARKDDLGLTRLEIVVGDAGQADAYEGAVPADLVLMCGVFGNISDADIQRTASSVPMLAAPGATVIWTRHRGDPDLTPSIRDWFRDAGCTDVAFDPVPDSPASVGVARFEGKHVPLVDQTLFTFMPND